jgi:hypothetical protein
MVQTEDAHLRCRSFILVFGLDGFSLPPAGTHRNRLRQINSSQTGKLILAPKHMLTRSLRWQHRGKICAKKLQRPIAVDGKENPKMTNKSDFTPEEWKTLLEGVMMSGLAVSAAEPSGLLGMMKESFAASHALVEARSGPNELIRSIVADFETSEGRTFAREGLREKLSGAKAVDIKGKSIDTLKEVATMLETKAPEDAKPVKEWLYHISQKVADADSEGGFMGFGGVKVSEKEKATLSEISNALKLAA